MQEICEPCGLRDFALVRITGRQLVVGRQGRKRLLRTEKNNDDSKQ